MKQAVHGILAILAACVVPASAPMPLAAQDVLAQPERPTFRRVAAPGAGHSGPRITVQIRPGDNFMTPDPNAVPVAAPAPPDSGPDAPVDPDAEASWFWSAVSPALPGDPSRYWTAESLFAEPPPEAQSVTPRLNHVSQIAEAYGRELLAATVGTQVSPAFALAVISVESAGRQQAVSHAGAQGLMQLIPATAERFGVTDPFDPAQNIRGGVAYLDWLMEEFDRDPILVLAAYNAGEGAVRRAGGVPDYAETRNYVPKVLAAWQVTRSLCRTRPDLVSDGCVFMPIAVR